MLPQVYGEGINDRCATTTIKFDSFLFFCILCVGLEERSVSSTYVLFS